MAKPYGLANQKLGYIQMFLNIEKSGQQDKERCTEWLVNMDPGNFSIEFLLPRRHPLPFEPHVM